MGLSSWVRRAALGLGLALSVAVVACGDDDDGGGGSSRSALIEEICSASDTCCQQEGKENDRSACVAFYTAFVASQTYDAVKGEACLASIKKARQDGAFCSSGGVSDDDGSSEDGPCDGVFTDPDAGKGGTKQPGEPCSSESDCAKVDGATDAYCLTSSTTGPDGTSKTEKYCVVEITLSVGDACGGDEKGYDRSCNSKKGDSCDYTTKKCVAAKAEGEDCSTGSSCADGLYCAYDGTKSVCAKKVAAGASCEDSSSACVDSAYCDSTTSKCVAKLAGGASCTKDQSCASGYCVNGACDKGSSGSSGSLCFSRD